MRNCPLELTTLRLGRSLRRDDLQALGVNALFRVPNPFHFTPSSNNSNKAELRARDFSRFHVPILPAVVAQFTSRRSAFLYARANEKTLERKNAFVYFI